MSCTSVLLGWVGERFSPLGPVLPVVSCYRYICILVGYGQIVVSIFWLVWRVTIADRLLNSRQPPIFKCLGFAMQELQRSVKTKTKLSRNTATFWKMFFMRGAKSCSPNMPTTFCIFVKNLPLRLQSGGLVLAVAGSSNRRGKKKAKKG